MSWSSGVSAPWLHNMLLMSCDIGVPSEFLKKVSKEEEDADGRVWRYPVVRFNNIKDGQ